MKNSFFIVCDKDSFIITFTLLMCVCPVKNYLSEIILIPRKFYDFIISFYSADMRCYPVDTVNIFYDLSP